MSGLSIIRKYTAGGHAIGCVPTSWSPPAKELQRYHDKAISLITWMEVMVGASDQEVATVKGFLAQFELLPIGPATAAAAVNARRVHGFKLPDAIIFASAELGERLLVTRNSKDFPPGLAGVRIPYGVDAVARPRPRTAKRSRK